MEKTGQTRTDFKSIIEKLDHGRPQAVSPDWAIFERILGQTDFTKTKNVLESFNLFYENLWMHVIFPLEDEAHDKNREIGRLIVEADQHRRQAEKLQEEVDTLRKRLQEEGPKEA